MKSYLSVLVLCVALSPASASDAYIQTDRFTVVEAGPAHDERDPLSVVVQLNFPPSVVTVEDAMKFALKRSGWDLMVHPAGDSALSLTLSRPLPLTHRSLSSMPLRTALHTLVGSYYEPIEDPIRRLYSFDLKDQYRGLVNDE